MGAGLVRVPTGPTLRRDGRLLIDGEKFRRGDHSHFREVVRAFGPLALQVARRFARDEAHGEDLFQEIWKQVFEKRQTYSGRGSFVSWLHRVAVNTCITDYRAGRIRRETLVLVEQQTRSHRPGWTPPDPLTETEQSESRERLYMALAQLPERELQAITLRILEDKTPGEVSEIMGIARATVRCHISRGVQRLKAMMETVPGTIRKREAVT